MCHGRPPSPPPLPSRSAHGGCRSQGKDGLLCSICSDNFNQSHTALSPPPLTLCCLFPSVRQEPWRHLCHQQRVKGSTGSNTTGGSKGSTPGSTTGSTAAAHSYSDNTGCSN
ncbi:hypothetical protein CLOM_g12006 [Closterium sp. NIES-68]|nr:hypothetical protein CLOM_g12006 [Closterium sp. NIES-68]